MDPMKKRALLMEHATHPRHYRKEERYVSVRAYSHTCADDLTLMVNIQDDVIEDVCFYGHACTIATAAASMMCEELRKQDRKSALKQIEAYERMLDQQPYEAERIGEEAIFADAATKANRRECAFLSWKAMRQVLEDER